MDPKMTLLTGLEATLLAGVMRRSPSSYPLVETVHVLVFILLIGAAAMFDLRLLGMSSRLPVSDMARHLLPWAHVGLVTVVISGALLFVVDPVALWFNAVFRARMALIFVAGLNAATCHVWHFRSVATWSQFASMPWPMKVAASFSLVLWITIAALGRLIAYIE